MKTKIVKSILMGIGLTLICLNNSANATIINTDQDSFVDTVSGLEWMDFGLNNHQSFNYVSSQLGFGGEYEGWRLPTINEVYLMWHNVANLDEVEADYENLHEYGMFQLYAEDQAFQSEWDHLKHIIGVNLEQEYAGQMIWSALGFFEGSDGLSFVSYQDRAVVGNDFIRLKDDDNFDVERNTIYENWSTLLVCAICEDPNEEQPRPVPEPNAFLLFSGAAFAMISLRRRFSKYQPSFAFGSKHIAVICLRYWERHTCHVKQKMRKLKKQ